MLSLLPSATEIVYALGIEDSLIGVSCDCDYPSQVSEKPVVSAKVLPISSSTSPVEIDRLVRAHLQVADSIYSLDRELIQQLRPDVILAQDLCRVCAVPSGHIEEALDVIGCTADVLSLDPHSLEEVLDCIVKVGEALGVPDRAASTVAGLRERLGRIEDRLEGATRKHVVTLEWQDPPFNGGHWVPEMVELAGGRDVLGEPGERSRTLSWSEIASASPDVVIYMPCGYGLDEAVAQLPGLYDNDLFRTLPAVEAGEVFVTDSSSYFSRPGPRLVDGVEILAGVLHPDVVGAPPGDRVLRVANRGGVIETTPV